MTGYSTDKPETTLQDVSNLFCSGMSALLAGDVTSRMPAQIKADLTEFLRWSAVEQGWDVGRFLLNSDKERLQKTISNIADQHQITLILGDKGLIKHHSIDVIVPIGRLDGRLIDWAKGREIQIYKGVK